MRLNFTAGLNERKNVKKVDTNLFSFLLIRDTPHKHMVKKETFQYLKHAKLN